jgi:hypothetical protein
MSIREKYGFYPEAYYWMIMMTTASAVFDMRELIIAGCVPGACMSAYYYIAFIREQGAELRERLYG